ncbi:MAG: BMP family ABC transporter substrate-binding protein [Nitriliruptorales bacterium]|nr:BMP family ABC transporter substrate-binding protein [Nitriliruptorales bacterium]
MPLARPPTPFIGGHFMRVPRRLTLVCAALAMLLLLAACGNDPEASGDGDATEPSGETTDTTTTEEPTSAGATESSDSIIPLDQVCEEEYADVEAPDDFSVRLVTDIGSVDDGTFNQYANEGMQAAADCFGIDTDYIETANEADYENNLNTALEDDPNVVVTVGFLLADATKEFAGDNPDVNFIGVDQFQEDYGDNYAGVLFREDQGGFLAGAMAGLLTESGTVGVVGGREDVPPVVRLVNGYEMGAKHIAEENGEDVNVLKTYNESFTDKAKGRSDAEQMLGEGADVIFGAGGQTGSGGVQAAVESGAWGIGVDQDEYFTTFQGGEAQGVDKLATSAVKRVDLGVFENIAATIQDRFEPGIFTLDAANEGITYAPFHDADIPEDVASKLEEIRQGLADESIDTGLDPVTGLPK